jgi:hypothetical protein
MKWERTFQHTETGVRTGIIFYSLYLPNRSKSVAEFIKTSELCWFKSIEGDCENPDQMRRWHPRFATAKDAKAYAEYFFREEIALEKAVYEVKPQLSPSNPKRL